MGQDDVPFGTWLLSKIHQRGWDGPSDLARAIGVKPATVSRWINGTRTPPYPYCVMITDALRLDLAEVLRRSGNEPRDDRDLIADLPEDLRWFFLNYHRLPAERQRLLMRQLSTYYEDLELPDPTKGVLGDS